MKSLIFTLLFFALFGFTHAQAVFHVPNISPEEDFDNIKVKSLYSDERSSTFLIWVKKNVRAHKHADHTETVYVLEGTAEMTLGEETFPIKAGDYLVIKKGVVHSVEVTSDTPVKVLSIQAPEFLGKDRIFVD